MRATCLAALLFAPAGAWGQTDTPTDTSTRTPTITPTPTVTTAPCGTPPYIITGTTDDTNAGSLRWAVSCCNGDNLSVPAGTYTLSLGDILVLQTCTVTGAGASSTIISGNDASRIFHVSGSTTDFVLVDTTLTHGFAPLGDDPACEAWAGPNAACGGALLHRGRDLTLTRDVIRDSATSVAGAGSEGGGLWAQGSFASGGFGFARDVDIEDTNFISNSDSQGSGGAMLNYPSGRLAVIRCNLLSNTGRNGGGLIIQMQQNTSGSIRDSTFSNNMAALGGGLFFGSASVSTPPLVVVNSTFTGNTATSDGGGIQASGNGVIQLVNVTIGPNTSPSGEAISSNLLTLGSWVTNSIADGTCSFGGSFAPASLGFNIESGTSCGFLSVGDFSNTNPKLNALANNGGPTDTMSLQVSSPARNNGSDTVCASTYVGGMDQRGDTRPGTAQVHCSIGAYEAQDAAAPTVTPTRTPTCGCPPTRVPSPTRIHVPTRKQTPTVTPTP